MWNLIYMFSMTPDISAMIGGLKVEDECNIWNMVTQSHLFFGEGWCRSWNSDFLRGATFGNSASRYSLCAFFASALTDLCNFHWLSQVGWFFSHWNKCSELGRLEHLLFGIPSWCCITISGYFIMVILFILLGTLLHPSTLAPVLLSIGGAAVVGQQITDSWQECWVIC